jgi:hypothetical protein
MSLQLEIEPRTLEPSRYREEFMKPQWRWAPECAATDHLVEWPV